MVDKDLKSLCAEYERTTGPLSDEVADLLCPLLARNVADAYSAQPEAGVPRGILIARVAAIAGLDLAALAELHLSDLLLAERCLAGETRAVRALDDMLATTVRDVIRSKLSLTQVQTEEVMQLVRVRMLVATAERPARLASYRAQGKLSAWARVVALRIALDANVKSVDETESLVQAAALDLDDPELRLLCERYGPLLRDAIERSVRILSRRERTLLKMSIVDALTIDQIGAIYTCHRATAARWVSAAREALIAHAREQFCALAKASESDFISIVRALPSYLDVSLERILREPTQLSTAAT
jgi:RNA polymerase sigma-70 factor, ECF subfamily